MTEHQVPEMRRVPLENLVLRIRRERPYVGAFLAKALDPPPLAAVDAAIASLQRIAALDPATGALTPLGLHLAALPIDVRSGKIEGKALDRVVFGFWRSSSRSLR